jgi:hypothetical protein
VSEEKKTKDKLFNQRVKIEKKKNDEDNYSTNKRVSYVIRFLKFRINRFISELCDMRG